MNELQESEYCGVGIRAVALAVDALVWFALFFVATLPVAAFTGDLQVTEAGVNAHLTGTPGQVAFVLWLALSLAYHTITESKYGRTAGKYLVKIEVAGADGTQPSLRTSLVRNVARLVDVLPFFYVVGIVLAVASDRHRRLGDRLADTVVVRS